MILDVDKCCKQLKAQGTWKRMPMENFTYGHVYRVEDKKHNNIDSIDRIDEKRVVKGCHML